MLVRLVDAVFPPSCAACARGAWPFCPTCASTLVRFDVTLGEPPPEGVDAVVAPFTYEGAARRAVLNLKFAGARQVVGALAAPMADALGAVRADGITWAPLGPRRRRERGFDQGRLLARAIGRGLGVPVAPLLARTRETAPQARRGAAERRLAMGGAFASRRPAPPSVLLVDDVVTTGATVAACAAALRAAGARRVVVLAAARAIPRSYTSAGSASGSVVARGTSPR